MRRMPSRYVHATWVGALAACLLVPLATLVIQSLSVHSSNSETLQGASESSPTLLTGHEQRGFLLRFHARTRSVPFPPIFTLVLVLVYAALIFFDVVRLVWFLHRTTQLRKGAYVRAIPPALSRVAKACLRSFSLSAIPILCSDKVAGPSTLGFRSPVLILPLSFFTGELSEHDLSAALSHELAHIRRRDFSLNLLYEIAYVPIGFHPTAALIKARIAHTRELACDEMAARGLPSGALYARSLLHIAQSMFAAAPSAKSSYALGLFDTHALEERIMNILKPRTSKRWTRTLTLIAVSVVGAASLGISAFSLNLDSANAPADVRRFAGTWEAKYKGKVFFTLKLDARDSSLTGSCIHTDRVEWVDGELIPTGDDTTGRIVEAHTSGQKLTVKCTDGNDSSDGITLELTLTAKDDGEGKVPKPDSSEVPPQKKPWHFRRTADQH